MWCIASSCTVSLVLIDDKRQEQLDEWWSVQGHTARSNLVKCSKFIVTLKNTFTFSLSLHLNLPILEFTTAYAHPPSFWLAAANITKEKIYSLSALSNLSCHCLTGLDGKFCFLFKIIWKTGTGMQFVVNPHCWVNAIFFFKPLKLMLRVCTSFGSWLFNFRSDVVSYREKIQKICDCPNICQTLYVLRNVCVYIWIVLGNQDNLFPQIDDLI